MERLCSTCPAKAENASLRAIVDELRRGEAIPKLEAEIEQLQAALKPFADCVHNDNGDVTVTYGLAVPHDYFRAYCVLRDLNNAAAPEQGALRETTD